MGAILALFTCLLESLIMRCEVIPDVNYLGNFSIMVPFFDMYYAEKTVLNWKYKSLTFFTGRNLVIICNLYYYGSLSPSFLLANYFTMGAIAFWYKEKEDAFLELYDMNKENEKEKLKWISIMDTLPFFIFIYDHASKKLNYFNKHLSSLMQWKKNPEQHISKLLGHHQKIDVEEKDQLLGIGIQESERLDKMSLEEFIILCKNKKLNKLNIKLKDWKKSFQFISNNLNEQETLAIFIDTSLNKQLETKQLQQKIITLFLKSLTHKFLTPINSIGNFI
mmetsp:Transcript_30146/g.29432  ORF Transcript_30146/g.29432 Transcript_30146/m.29432 type:complete len:278 (-) Transcript_30146:1212-2045(-)